VPRDIASRSAKEACDDGRGVGPEVGGQRLGVFLDFKDAINRLGEDAISARYGNLFEMYERITDDSPYKTPMRIYPAIHYTMGGLWVDYNLQSNIPGLFVIGEANFSDHGANRLGASALMQGLADGYFVLPATIGNYFGSEGADIKRVDVSSDSDAAKEARNAVDQRIAKLMSIKGERSPDSFHRELGKICWDNCGMARNKEGLTGAIEQIRNLRDEFWQNVRILGDRDTLN
jgi:succinate dehydrogenase / fumarate reductase flavoprotein subunit